MQHPAGMRRNLCHSGWRDSAHRGGESARIQGEGTPAPAHFHSRPWLPTQPAYSGPKSWQSPEQKPPGESSLPQRMPLSGFPASTSIATSPSLEGSGTLAPFQPPSTKANRNAFQPSQRASPQATCVLGLKRFFVNSTGGLWTPAHCHHSTTHSPHLPKKKHTFKITPP